MMVTDEVIFRLRDAAKHGDVKKFDETLEQCEESASAEWACIAVVALILVAGLFGAGYAVGRASGLREARSAAVVEAARRDGLAVLTGAVALAAHGGDAIKAARFVRGADAAKEGGAK